MRSLDFVRREEYLVMSLRTFQKIPAGVGSAVLVRRSSAPPSQMPAMRSYCSPLHRAWKWRTTRDHGAGHRSGGVYKVV